MKLKRWQQRDIRVSNDDHDDYDHDHTDDHLDACGCRRILERNRRQKAYFDVKCLIIWLQPIVLYHCLSATENLRSGGCMRSVFRKLSMAALHLWFFHALEAYI